MIVSLYPQKIQFIIEYLAIFEYILIDDENGLNRLYFPVI